MTKPTNKDWVSLELAKWLREAGWKKETEFYWLDNGKLFRGKILIAPDEIQFPAPLAPLIPLCCPFCPIVTKPYCPINVRYLKAHIDALAKMWPYLKEEKLI